MKRVTKKLKQSLSILLAVAMVITCLPQTATAVMAAENEVVDTEGVDVNDVETTDVVDDAEVVDDVDAVADTEDVDAATDTEDVSEPGSVEENAEEGGDDTEIVADDAEVLYATEVAETAYEGNASEGKYVFFVGELDKGTLTEDKPVGTEKEDNSKYFTVKLGTVASLAVEENGQKFDIDNDTTIACTKRLKLGGTSKPDERVVAFTVTNVPATVTAFAHSSGSQGTAFIRLFDSDNTNVGDEIECTYKENGKNDDGSTKYATEATVAKWTISKAGTYYIGSKKGNENPNVSNPGKKDVNLYGVIVQEANDTNPVDPTPGEGDKDEGAIIKVSADDLDKGDIIADKVIANGVVDSSKAVLTITAKDGTKDNDGKTYNQHVVVDSGSSKFTFKGEEKSTTQRIKLGGAGKTTQRSIKVQPEKSGTFTAFAISSSTKTESTDTRTVYFDEVCDPNNASAKAFETKVFDKVTELTAEVEGGKTYYFYSGAGGLNVYYMALEYSAGGTTTPVDPDPVDPKPTPDDPQPGTSTVLDISKYDYATSGKTVIKKDDGGTEYDAVEITASEYLLDSVFEVLADDGKDSKNKLTGNVTVIDTAKTITGSNFTKRLNMNGVGNKSKRAVKFEVTGPSTLTYYIMSNSPKGDPRNLMLDNDNGTEPEKLVAKAPAEGVNEISADELKGTKDLEKGTYYLYCEGSGINIYYLALTDRGVEPEIPKPAITNLTVELEKSTGVYNAQPHEVKVASVKWGETVVEEANYTATYPENPTNIGEYTVTVTAKNVAEAEYSEKTGTATYTITPCDIANATVTKPVVDKKQNTVKVTVNANNEELVENTDYTVTYEYNDKDGKVVAKPDSLAAFEGSVKATVTGKGNYTGTNTSEYAELKPSAPDKVDESKETEYRVWFVVENDDDTYYDDFEAGALISEDEVYAAIGRPEDVVIAGVYKDSAFTAKSKWNYSTSVVNESMTLYVHIAQVSENKDFYIPSIPDQAYTGAPIKPVVAVYAVDEDGVKTLLKNGKDYKVTYENNTNANINPDLSDEENEAHTKPEVVIEGKGNYDKTVRVPFNIVAVSIGSEDTFAKGFTAKVTESLVENKGKQLKPFASIKYKKAMKVNVDFEVNVYDAENTAATKVKDLPVVTAVGDYTLEVKGIGNFCGTVTLPINVAEQALSLSKATVKLGKNVKSMPFSDIEVNADGTISIGGVDIAVEEATDKPADNQFLVQAKDKTFLAYGDDYTYEVVYSNGTTDTPALGKAQLIIKAEPTSDKCSGKKVVAFTVKGEKLKKEHVILEDGENGFKENVDYNGKAHTQNDKVAVIVPGKEGDRELAPKTDYTITYKNNIKKGTAVMTIKATPESGYTGSVPVKFKIDAVGIDTDAVEPSYGLTKENSSYKLVNDDLPLTKAGVQPTEFGLKNAESGVPLVKGTDYTVSYKNNKAAGSNAQIIIKGKGSYSGSITVDFTIRTASLSEMYYELDMLNVTTASVAHKAGKSAADLKPAVKVLDGKKALAGKGKEYDIVEYVGDAEAVQAFVDDTEGTVTKPTVKIKGVGAYVDQEGEPEIEVPLNIYKKDNKFNKKNVLVEAANTTYANGKQVTTAVTVKFDFNGDGKFDDDEVLSLENGDYKLTWGKNNAASNKPGNKKGSVKVEGQGRFGGSVTAKFDIISRDLNDKADRPGPGPGPDEPVNPYDPYTQNWYDFELDKQIKNYIDEYNEIISDKANYDVVKDITGLVTSVEYDATYNRVIVTLKDTPENRDKKIKPTFEAFKDKYVPLYENSQTVQKHYDELKEAYDVTYKADLDNVTNVNVKVTAPSGESDKRDFARKDYIDYINDNINKGPSQLIESALNKYPKLLDKYSDKLQSHDADNIKISKLENDTFTSTTTMTYKDGKSIELEYSVFFKFAK